MSPDEDMTKEQLINEVAGLRQRLAELEALGTERKWAEEALQESEERIHTIVSNAPVVIWSLDKEGIFTLSEGAGLKALGLRPGEVVGQSVFDVYHDVPQICEDNRRALAGETFVSIIEVEELVFEAHYSPIRDKSGEVNGIVGVATDITERKQAEDNLRLQSEIAANMSEGVCLVRVDDGMIAYTNPKFEEMFGYEPGGMVGQHVSIVNAPADKHPEETAKEIAAIMDRTGVWSGEVQNIKKDRTPFWCYVNATVFNHPEYGEVGVAVHTDITEHRQAEEALKESEYRFRRLFEESNDAVFIHDFEGRILDVNDAASKMLGYSKDELMKMLIPTLHQEEELTASKGAFQTTMKKGSVRFETKFRKSDGTMIDVDISSRIVDRGREVIQGIVRDITERKQAEESLRLQAEIIANMSEGVYLVGVDDGVVHYTNPKFEAMFGYEPGGMVGKHVSMVNAPTDKSPEETVREIMGIIRKTGEWHGEVNNIRKDGTPFWCYVNVSVFNHPEYGEVLVAIHTDITERRQAEEREQEVQQELNISRHLVSIGELAAGVAHEINNPLTGILGFSERLMKKSVSQEISRDLERIRNEAQRAARVVGNLLTFARRREPRKEYLDVNEILAKTVELRAYELRTGNIKLEVELASSLPEIVGDFGQIQQVFLNIILNAEQAMAEANRGGKLSIKTQKAKGCIRISFADDGPGIPAENRDRVFDPFFTTRGDRGGTGLGLSASHGIVTEHGGRIYARSKPGQGATFFVELPLKAEGIDKRKVAEKKSVRRG